MQRFKTVYFADHPSQPEIRSGLTVSFPDNERRLFGAVARLSSHAIRNAIGHQSFGELQQAAARAGTTTSSYVRDRLRLVVRPEADRQSGIDTAIQSTFVGGKGSPLHDWFPYLEGYSPDFVRSVITSYAPVARSVLDPFCGSGTTALTASAMGLRAGYCEVNPVCRRIIEAKSIAIEIRDADRSSISSKLQRLADQLPDLLAGAGPAEDIRLSLVHVFGKRPFFQPEVLRLILALRTLVDQLLIEDDWLGRFAEVAVMGCLVSNSLLVRRGDLRFRTETELAQHMTDPVGQVADRLRMIASDLLDLDRSTGSVTLAAPDIRDLNPAAHGIFEAVVTSPPYLNGTNYFRNTKIELWFARHLSNRAELRTFRDVAITSGINDVTNGKSSARDLPESDTLLRTLAALGASTYDQRIPKMAAAYFAEMDEAFGRLHRVVKKDACVALDLGDSCYGQVHVATDLILRELLTRRGFDFEREVVLRERLSRSGRPLRQTLQIFRVN